MFVDKAKITITSGKGGNGAVSFRREPFVPEGGPDGGDGGNGGDVVFVSDGNLKTLLDFKWNKTYKAEDGENGMKKNCYGKSGKDLILKVPVGTVVIDDKTGKVIKDLVKDQDRVIAAKGGKGGKGNSRFKSSTRQAPNFAEAGGEGSLRTVRLSLKLIADVGLIGFPNVGKSTLLRAATNANPKIANYHFTTLVPNLGICEIYDDSFVIADIAGLIEGAHKGAGLGHEFLKHIERTRLLIHVVDGAETEGRKAKDDFDKINRELSLYGKDLSNKIQIVAFNKKDLICDMEDYEEFKGYVEGLGYSVFPISAATGEGVRELLAFTLNRLKALPKEDEPSLPLEEFTVKREDEQDDFKLLEASKEGEVYRLSGKQLKKIFDSTNFNDLGSLRYLYKYIEKNQGIAKLKALGLEEGDVINLFGYEFIYNEED